MPFIKPKKEENIQRVTDFIQALKGDTGPEGYTPVKGVDYLTDEELAIIKKEATPIKSIDYNDGKDGATGPRGNQGVKGDRGDSIIGPAGKDGLNGSPDAPEDIVAKLNTQEDAVDITVIKGLKKRLDCLNNQPIPASIRIRAKINGVEQNEPVGSINFPTGSTHTGQDYTVVSSVGGSVPIQDEGSTITASPSAINFVGGGVTVTDISGIATVTIPNSGSSAVYSRDNQTSITGTSLTLPSTPSYGLEIHKNGLLLTITTDYTVTGTSVTLATAAVSSDRFSSVYWVGTSSATYTRDTQTGLTGTSITIPSTPTYGYELYKNGLLLTLTTDYTISGTSVTLTTAATTADIFNSIYYV